MFPIIVEDPNTMQAIIRESIDDGLNIFFVEKDNKAGSLFQIQQTNPDIIILDIDWPVSELNNFVVQVNEVKSEERVIIFTKEMEEIKRLVEI